MSDTYAFKTHFGTLPTRETYIKSVNKAVAAVSTGTIDYHTAIRQTVKELADSGLRNVYIDGDVAPARVRWINEDGETYYSRRVDSSVRMNVLEGARRINQEILNDAGEKYATGYEISAHDRPAPDHAELQGKQYTKAEYEQLNASLTRPIGTLNCMHIAFPIIYGVSKPAYTEEQLEQFKANAGKQYKYKGKVFNGYECTQEQRRLETNIRRHQNRIDAARAAGDELMAAREKKALKQARAEYREFSEAVGLSVKNNRAQGLKVNNEIVANSSKDAIISLPDIQIHKSIGAKAKNYDILDLETGEYFKFAEGTRIQNVEVFAGKGTKHILGIAEKYAHRHGGKPEDWQHAKGHAVLVTDDGDRAAEVHWMQCEGFGKHDFFVKKWED